MRRIAALFLSQLTVELALQARGLGAHARCAELPPLAVVESRATRPVRGEGALTMGLVLDAVSDSARQLGVAEGQTIAAARAICSTLVVSIVEERELTNALGGLAEALMAYGPTVSLDAERSLIWVDITGVAHLYRSADDADGERTLGQRILDVVRGLGHRSVLAIADGPETAAATARFGGQGDVCILARDRAGDAWDSLPLAALGLCPADVSWLSGLGLQTVAEVKKLPRPGLALRLGSHGARVCALLEGEDHAPLVPYVPAVRVFERAELDDCIESVGALLFVLNRLVHKLIARAKGRGLAICEVRIIIGLVSLPSVETQSKTVTVAWSEPSQDPHAMMSLIRARLDSFTIPAPVRSVTTIASRLESPVHRQHELYGRAAKASTPISTVRSELMAKLGPSNVGYLRVTNRWLITERSILVGSDKVRNGNLSEPLVLQGVPEPFRFLKSPIAHREHAPIRWLQRIETIEWWMHESKRVDIGLSYCHDVASVAWVTFCKGDASPYIVGWVG